MWYKIANASEYLVITGMAIKDIKLSKKAWILPGQSCTKFDITPVNYTFEVQAMSSEKLPFILPAVFTIGPRADDHESLMKYAKLIAPHDKNSRHVQELVQGVIEGETRVLAASMTMEEVFNGAKRFKLEVFEKVQLELDQFGLVIYNSNIKQLVDIPGHEYFSYLGQKTQMEAANQAKIDVAEAKKKGEIGAKLREGETTQNAAKIDAETKIYSAQRDGFAKKENVKVKTDVQIYENERVAEVAEANAELATKKSAWQREAQLAEVEADKAVKLREVELQSEVERKNAMTRTEKLKAEFLSKATVEYETKKHYTWRPELEGTVRDAFDAKAGLRLKDIFNDTVHKRKHRPNWLGEDMYQAMKGRLDDKLFKERSARAKANRRGGDASGKAQASHCAGSVSTTQRAKQLVQQANSDLYQQQKKAEATLFNKEKEASAQKTLAEASFYTRQQEANAELYAKQKQAEGILAFAHAQGTYLSTLLEALGGDYVAARDYMMINNRMFQDIAKTNAEAIKGLQPQISVWTNGGGGGGGDGSSDKIVGGSAMTEIANVYRSLPPLFKTVQEQTGMDPPAWLGTLKANQHAHPSN